MSGLYNPEAFRIDDPALLGDVVDALTFGTLISNGPDGPQASHLPMLLVRGGAGPGILRGHLARANPHLAVLDDAPALVIFQGPDHYVSPSWYPSKRQTGKVVPTWNYVVVHARGRVRLQRDARWLSALIGTLTDHMERSRTEPWAVADAPAAYVSRMVDQIVGIEVPLTSLEGKFKLGQNRTPADRRGLAAGLGAEQPDIAAALRRLPGCPTDL